MTFRLALIPILSGLVLLAGCDSARKVNATAPTVTYAYNDADAYGTVQERADDHCAERYGKLAVLIERVQTDTGYEATFACE